MEHVHDYDEQTGSCYCGDVWDESKEPTDRFGNDLSKTNSFGTPREHDFEGTLAEAERANTDAHRDEYESQDNPKTIWFCNKCWTVEIAGPRHPGCSRNSYQFRQVDQ